MDLAKVMIEMTTTTCAEHHSRGKLSSSYTTTIPLEVSFNDAREIIRQIAAEIAALINDDYRAEVHQENTSTYLLTSVTRDMKADRYCFSAEYSSSVDEFVLRYAECEIEVDCKQLFAEGGDVI